MKKLFFLLVAMATTLFTLNSCSSPSSERAKARKAKADSIASAQQQPQKPVITPEQPKPEKTEIVFTPVKIGMTPVQENYNDKCGEGQYACHTYSVDFVLTDSVGAKYLFTISETTTKESLDDYVEKMKQAKQFYAEMTNENLNLTKLKFVYHQSSKELDVFKITPQSGKKVGKVELLDAKEELLYTADCNRVLEKNLYKIYTITPVAGEGARIEHI